MKISHANLIVEKLINIIPTIILQNQFKCVNVILKAFISIIFIYFQFLC